MGSGDLRGGRIGRSTTHRSVGQGGIGPGRKTLRSPCLRACATGRISMRPISFLGNPAISHEQIMLPISRRSYQEAAERRQILMIGDTDRRQSLDASGDYRSRSGRTRQTRPRASLSTASLLSMPKTSSRFRCIGQQPFVREPAPKGKPRQSVPSDGASRSSGKRASSRSGPVPAGTQWIYVEIGAATSSASGKRVRIWDMTMSPESPRNRNVLIEEEEEQRGPNSTPPQNPGFAACQPKESW